MKQFITTIKSRFEALKVRSLKSMLSHVFYPASVVLLLHGTAFAQVYTASPDLNHIKGSVKEKLKKPVKITGGAALNAVYADNTPANQGQPFTWIAAGNLNLNIAGYSLPFSFNYTNRKIQRTNPAFKFNRLSLNPKYKEWTAHAGDVSASFSPYTLSGFQYTGAGLEYNKGKWQAQVLYGRFLRAITEEADVTPSYLRMGWGTKAVYGEQGKKIGLSVFHAKDDIHSIPAPALPANSAIRPMEGTAIAIEASYPILKKLVVSAEHSVSVVTRDLQAAGEGQTNTSFYYTQSTPSISTELFHAMREMLFVFSGEEPSFLKNLVGTRNSSTEVYRALKAGATYSFAQSTTGLTYERVDPGYHTPGGYFFTNDFENIAANFSQNFWKGKMTASVNAGVQRDDLANTKESNLKRFLFAGNISVRPAEKWNIGVSYSNMKSYTFLRSNFTKVNEITPYQNLDTLNFTQLSQNMSANVSYLLAQTKTQSQNLSFNASYMEGANQKGDVIRYGDLTRFFNGALNYSLTLPDHGITCSAGFLYSYNYAAKISGVTKGPMATVSKLFL